MKIALVIEHFDATRGGAEHLAVWIANEMAKRGHEVHVVCHDVTSRVNRYRQATLRASHDADASFPAHPAAPPETPHAGLQVHRLKGMRVNTALGLRRFEMRVRAWCRKHKPEVVHSLTVAYAGDVYQPYAGVYAAMQKQAAESRHTGATAALKRVMLRLPGKQRTLLALERRAVEGTGRKGKGSAKVVVSVCRMMTRQFMEHYGNGARGGAKIVELATPRMEINGTRRVSAEEAARLRGWFRGNYGIGEKDRVAIFVGHDFWRKGLRYAIEAIAQTKAQWKLLVVGLGKAREYVELADALGIGDANVKGAGERRVLFVGPTREMASAYSAADAMLLPTFYDPSGLVVLEAFGFGLPVVSTEFLGASELVKGAEAGVIVETPREVGAMAAALDGLPGLGTAEQGAMAERARSASDGISAGAYIDALLDVYKRVKTA